MWFWATLSQHQRHHVSRSITWSLFTLKAWNLVKWLHSTQSFMNLVSIFSFTLLARIETRPSPLPNFGMAYSRQIKTQICTVGEVGIRRPWISLISHPLGSSPHITNKIVSLEICNTSLKCPIYLQNLGWLAKRKSPDQLGFSRHLKTIHCLAFLTS